MCNDRIKKNLPKVMVNDDITNESYVQDLARMMKVGNGEEVNDVLRVMFSKIGYTENDTITISKVVKSAFDSVRLEFEVNGEYAFKTVFHRRYGKDCVGLSLTDKNKDHYMYKCDISRDEDDAFDVKMNLKGSEVGQGRNLVISKKNSGSFKYSFFSPAMESGFIEQVIGLEVYCTDEEKKRNISNGEYASPKNEKALIAYLSNCTFPVNIGELFEVVKELSFDGDLTNLPSFCLDVLTVINLSSYEERAFTDLIYTKNGELKRIGFSHIGEFEDCGRNCGGAVEFISGGGRAYSVLNLPGRWERLGCLYEADDRASKGFVDNCVKEIVRLFPTQAEKFLGSYYIKEEKDNPNQLSFFDGKPKQFSKIDDLKKNGDN